MQIDWINLLVFRLFHLFNKYTNSNLPYHAFLVEKLVEKVEKSIFFPINELLKIIFTKFCFPLDTKFHLIEKKEIL